MQTQPGSLDRRRGPTAAGNQFLLLCKTAGARDGSRALELNAG